jgi:hypothetical protein
VKQQTTDWERLEHPGFSVAFSYPSVTPQGYLVERAAERVEDHPVAGDFERVHLSSPDSGELYFELAHFADRTPVDEYRTHQPSLAHRFGSNAVSSLTETTFGGRAAWTYDIKWDAGERSVLLLAVGGSTYRVIYDPRSELNARVLATLTVSE